MRKIIVAVDESDGSRDAITLASALARTTDATLALVNVFPYDQHAGRAASRVFEDYLRQDSHVLLEQLRATVPGDGAVETYAVPNPSPAHGLHELATREDAGLIVIGSTHTGPFGRVLPGSTAERLLHGSPCPVAVAPRGYAERAADEPGVIGCGYDGSASAQQALVAARRVAQATGAQLRVIRAFRPLPYDVMPGSAPISGAPAYETAVREHAQHELETAVERLGSDVRATAEFTIGGAVDVLSEASEQLDLLLVGSRGYGPMHAVLVGGVAGRLVREAACPVIVVPRGAGHTDEDSLFAEALNASTS
jgi:nucleotide-binding universal stress UspA family protein